MARTSVSSTSVTPVLGENRYCRIHIAVTTRTPPTYQIANAKAATRHSRAALVDRGANGGLAGSDCCICQRGRY
jgi:HORMA domain